MSRLLLWFLLGVYCIGTFLAFDFIYSRFVYREPEPERSPRIPHGRYHHGLMPNFDGYWTWGGTRYRFITNSLGFRDSFTEGIGVDFGESFAGLLSAAGQDHANRIDFLNAGVVSYSPVIYLEKAKYLIESGVEFHEVVVFSDISDVQDEATANFCLDDDSRYRVYCMSSKTTPPARAAALEHWLNRRAVVTSRVIQMITRGNEWPRGTPRSFTLNKFEKSGWTLPSFDVGRSYEPLGVDGGIERSLGNMQKLSDLLAQHGISLTIVVYPWPMQLAHDDRASRQATVWRQFCVRNCKRFIDLFPAFFAWKDTHQDWYERLFIDGDVHFSPEGNRLVFQELAKHLR
jgi:hypothetical protein